MIDVEWYRGSKEIPSTCGRFEITVDGIISDNSGNTITLENFNDLTSYNVDDVAVLIAVTYQKFNWPPVYWKYLKALKTMPDITNPETIVLGIDSPVESIEYPGFYMIPYFSNYVITKDGYLLKKNTNTQIMASKGSINYYTFRMIDDSGKTQNQLRHRVLCLAFKPYSANVEDLDVNHKNGIPGDDELDNLEWTTRSGNIIHAYEHGLRTDNKPIEMKELNSGKTYIFHSCSAAARLLNVTETTISNRAKTNGYKAYSGMVFRFYPSVEPWPEFDTDNGKYLVEFPDGTSKKCDCNEASRLAGLTRTSLLRALREGRCFGTTKNKITRLS